MTELATNLPGGKLGASPRQKSKGNTSPTNSNAKTINTPGSSSIRVAQACDRCRAKKTKCDGKLPTCSSCAAVGFKCIVSDKLSRRAFPKGYTETLEERIRQLEAENKKLTGLIDLRDEQISMLNSQDSAVNNSFEPQIKVKQEEQSSDNIPSSTRGDSSTSKDFFSSTNNGISSTIHPSSSSGITTATPSTNNLTTSNLSLLDQHHSDTLHSHLHDQHDGAPCSCSDFPNHLHEGPVSIAGSYYDENNNKHSVSIPGSIVLSDNEDNESLLSFDDLQSVDSTAQQQHKGISSRGNRDVSPAPGAFAAATAIAQMQKIRQQQQSTSQNTDQQMLTSLVAISIPRSTEETLFIPTLLAKICQTYGYSSKPAILTANAIASLKEISSKSKKEIYNTDSNKLLMSLIMNRYDVTNQLPEDDAAYFIRNLINLPNSRLDLDHLITIYFQDWGNVFPILDKNTFLKEYVNFTNYLEGSKSDPASPGYESIEKYAAILVLVLSLSLISTNHTSQTEPLLKKYVSLLNHFDYLIKEFIKPNCIITRSCSIQSLQILALALQYCLVTGDITTCYELRGRVITMGQQLRLHRCPAAVLGIGGGASGNVDLQNFRQGERRILFWCIYSLDVYSSLSLGVPRLLKDFEVECALPFAGKSDEDDDGSGNDNVNILIVNNTKLSIVGKVSKFSLSVMLYSKVLANILDSIFSRYESGDQSAKTLSRERMLDCWRRELPRELKFEIDVNGLSLKNNKDPAAAVDGNIWKNYTRQQLTLIFLYYHAKILIYLPIISKFSNNHHNVGLSQKDILLKPTGDFSTNVVSSSSIIQQSSIQILEILKSLSSYSSSYLLPIPISLAREQARLALLVARGSLEYVKNGPLYQNSRALLLETIAALNTDSEYGGPGGLTKNSIKLLELAILSILGLNLNKSLIGKKKILQHISAQQQPPFKASGVGIGGSRPSEFDYTNSKISPTKTSNSGSTTPTQGSKLVNVQTASEARNGFFAKDADKIHFESRLNNGNLNNGRKSESNFAENASFHNPDANFNNEVSRTSSESSSELQTDDHSTDNTYINNSINNGMENDDIDGILEFDPFSMNLNPDLMMNEFAADGSLGLVPFLEMSNEGNYSNYSIDLDGK